MDVWIHQQLPGLPNQNRSNTAAQAVMCAKLWIQNISQATQWATPKLIVIELPHITGNFDSHIAAVAGYFAIGL